MRCHRPAGRRGRGATGMRCCGAARRRRRSAPGVCRRGAAVKRRRGAAGMCRLGVAGMRCGASRMRRGRAGGICRRGSSGMRRRGADGSRRRASGVCGRGADGVHRRGSCGKRSRRAPRRCRPGAYGGRRAGERTGPMRRPRHGAGMSAAVVRVTLAGGRCSFPHRPVRLTPGGDLLVPSGVERAARTRGAPGVGLRP